MLKLFLAAFIVLQGTVLSSAQQCKAEKIESLPIPNSDWAVEKWIEVCGFGVSGPSEIRASNAKTKKQILIALSESDHTKMTLDERGNLVISWPNSAVLSDDVKEFGGVKIVYNYLPHDDPEERFKWKRFRRDPKDPEALRWFCENVAAKREATSRAIFASMYGCPP